MRNLKDFESVNVIQSLLEINEGGDNQEVLLDNGYTVEMIKDPADYGTFTTYLTDLEGKSEYVAITNLYSMTGDLSKVITELQKL